MIFVPINIQDTGQYEKLDDRVAVMPRQKMV